MGEIYKHELIQNDGNRLVYHIDFDKNEVKIETGHKHPVTGRPLLRHASNNTLPFLYLKYQTAAPAVEPEVEPEVVAEDLPAITFREGLLDLEPIAFSDPQEYVEPVATGADFEATPVEDAPADPETDEYAEPTDEAQPE